MPPIGVKTLQKESDCIVGIPAKPVWRSKGKAVPPASNLWSVRIKSTHLKMPRPCAAESQVCIYSVSLLLPGATDLSRGTSVCGYYIEWREAQQDNPNSIYANLCAGGTAEISRWWNHR